MAKIDIMENMYNQQKSILYIGRVMTTSIFEYRDTTITVS